MATTVVKERELSGGEAQTTNNRMELLAAITALECAQERPCEPSTLHTDSASMSWTVISKWIHGWKKNGWKTADEEAREERRAVAGVLISRQPARTSCFKWHWVKGHAGHPENERADELAREGMAPFKTKTAPR
jgi:ribonuclease HI